MAGNDSVTSSHILFGNPVANICLSHAYNIHVKNAIALEEKNKSFSLEVASARR